MAALTRKEFSDALGPFPNKPTRNVCPAIRSKVSDAGLAHLAQLPVSLQHLELDLQDTKVPDALAFVLHRSGNGFRLRRNEWPR